MAAPQSLAAALDRLIEYFNRRTLDLPDGLFDRRTQFLINGVPFEALLSAAPNDALVLMLARGPAGYRFTAKALQHAVPDARLDRGEVVGDPIPATGATTELRLSGTLRGTGEPIAAVVRMHLRLNEAGVIDVAAADINETELAKIREARLRP